MRTALLHITLGSTVDTLSGISLVMSIIKYNGRVYLSVLFSECFVQKYIKLKFVIFTLSLVIILNVVNQSKNFKEP